MTSLTIPELTAEELEELFSDSNEQCEYRADATGIGGRTPLKCQLPATWVWVFETTCEHAQPEYRLCATHHVLLSYHFSEKNPWGCRTCLASAYVKEKRRL